ncbi:hypothetical protein ACT3QR_07685 [Psychrobacter sp. AOP7-B1-25]
MTLLSLRTSLTKLSVYKYKKGATMIGCALLDVYSMYEDFIR